MDVELGLAGVLCVLLALGHATLGLVWVLPGVRGDALPKTPFGPPGMTAATLHATWHIVTVFALSVGVILLTLALDAQVDVKSVLLRVFAAMWFGIAVVATWVALRRARNPRHLLRLPVPVFFLLVAVLCWNASA